MKFEELWKVKLLKDLLKLNKESKLKCSVTRDENSSIERDLKMIRYGYENGLKDGGSI